MIGTRAESVECSHASDGLVQSDYFIMIHANKTIPRYSHIGSIGITYRKPVQTNIIRWTTPCQINKWLSLNRLRICLVLIISK